MCVPAREISPPSKSEKSCTPTEAARFFVVFANLFSAKSLFGAAFTPLSTKDSIKALAPATYTESAARKEARDMPAWQPVRYEIQFRIVTTQS